MENYVPQEQHYLHLQAYSSYRNSCLNEWYEHLSSCPCIECGYLLLLSLPQSHQNNRLLISPNSTPEINMHANFSKSPPRSLIQFITILSAILSPISSLNFPRSLLHTIFNKHDYLLHCLKTSFFTLSGRSLNSLKIFKCPATFGIYLLF